MVLKGNIVVQRRGLQTVIVEVILRGLRIHEWGQRYGTVEILQHTAHLDIVIVVVTIITLL
jgi:hypothetical protein